MVFSSSPFLYAFLSLTLIFYFLIPNRVWRNGVLLAASLIFRQMKILLLHRYTSGNPCAGSTVIF